MTQHLTWPNGKKIAVSVTVMFETWSEGTAPTYSVQTTQLRAGAADHAGKAWSTYGGRVGVWRLIRMLDRLQIPGTFLTNARCVEEYPDAVKQIVTSGHDLAAHGYTQDRLLSYMTPEGSRRRSATASISWNPVVAERLPVGSVPCLPSRRNQRLFAQAGLTWTGDVTYVDLPIQIRTPHGSSPGCRPAILPTTVMRASPRDLYDAFEARSTIWSRTSRWDCWCLSCTVNSAADR